MKMGHDPAKYDFETIFAAANLATSLRKEDLSRITELLQHADDGVRFWGAIGLLTQGQYATEAAHDDLIAALKDRSPMVRITAAEALGRYGSDDDVAAALDVLLEYAAPQADAYLAIAAWNALDYLDQRASSRLAEIETLSPQPENAPARAGGYSARLKEKVIADLK